MNDKQLYIKKTISETRQISSLISILLIAVIYYSSKYNIDTKTFFNLNYCFQESFGNGISRSVVPLFAILSGFFIFIFHSRPQITGIHKILEPYLNQAYMFYAAFPIAIILSLVSAFILNKYLPALYSFITGSRNPNKVLLRNTNNLSKLKEKN